MFGFFKKKGEEPEEKAREQQPAQNTGNKQFKELAAQFQQEAVDGFRRADRLDGGGLPRHSPGGVCTFHHRG